MKKIGNKTTVLILEDYPKRINYSSLFDRELAKFELIFSRFDKIYCFWEYLKARKVDLILLNFKFTSLKKINLINFKLQIYNIKARIPIIFLLEESQEIEIFKKQREKIDPNLSGSIDYIVNSDLAVFFLKRSIANILLQNQKTQELEFQLKSIQELFKTVVDSTSALIWAIDTQEKYTFLNQSWLSFTGLTLEEGLKENWRDRIHPEDLEKCILNHNSALKKCQGFQIEYRLRRFDRSYRTILNTAVHQYNVRGEFTGLLCSCLDITQRKKAEQKIVRQAQIDRILADITQDIHSSLDLDTILQTATEKVNQYLSAEKISIAKITDNQLSLLFTSKINNLELHCNLTSNKQLPDKELIDNFERLAKGHIITSSNISLTEIINLDNSDLPDEAYSFLLIPILANNKLWGLILVEQTQSSRSWQINEIKFLNRVAIQLGVAIVQSELYQELEALAVVDSLTKIANRRKFDRYLAAEWKRLTREKNSLSLIFCDVDHFKLYNDTYGHQAGDLCLQKVAQAIKKAIKRPADLVARYGGEEFAVILPNTDLGGAKYLAQQIRLQIQSLKIPHINSTVDLYITLSLGVSSSIPNNRLGYYALVAAADKGLYKAKALGRNRVVTFELENL